VIVKNNYGWPAQPAIGLADSYRKISNSVLVVVVEVTSVVCEYPATLGTFKPTPELMVMDMVPSRIAWS
jgi:hypothetical protein